VKRESKKGVWGWAEDVSNSDLKGLKNKSKSYTADNNSKFSEWNGNIIHLIKTELQAVIRSQKCCL